MHTRGCASAKADQALDDLRKKYLLMHCHKIMSQRLSAWFRTVLDAYHATLDKELVHNSSGSSKMLYLDAMRDLAAKREAMEQSFSLELVKHYYHGVKPDGWHQLVQKASVMTVPGCDWSDELEHQLMDELIEKADEQYERLLATLLSQYRVLIGMQVTAETLPVSPRNVCRTFNLVMASLRADIDIKQQAYQCFESLLLDAMALVYLEIYEYLAQEGVLAYAPQGMPQDPVLRIVSSQEAHEMSTDQEVTDEQLLSRVCTETPLTWREHLTEVTARLIWKSRDGAAFLFELLGSRQVVSYSRNRLLALLRDYKH